MHGDSKLEYHCKTYNKENCNDTLYYTLLATSTITKTKETTEDHSKN